MPTPAVESRAELLARRAVPDPGQPDDAALIRTGLTEEQVATRRSAGLTNEQPKDISRSLWSILYTHIFTLFNLVIALCAIGIAMLGRWLDMLFSLAAVTNVVIGVVQEYSAKLKLDRIALLNQDEILVVRDGQSQSIPLEQAVLDDVVVLRRGDQVPADATVLESSNLALDESMLTGEADPVPKLPGDTVWSGTSVLSGGARIRLTRVGRDSHAADLTRKARKFVRIHSELRAALDKVAKWISIILIPLIAVVTWGQIQTVGGWHQVYGDAVLMENVLVAVVAGITTMIPQGLALMTTISFALAALNLVTKKVLIQESAAVEVLARVDTVCLDKTGTLTEGGMTVNTTQQLSPVDGWEQVLAFIGADENANATAAALGEEFTRLPTVELTDQVPFDSARRWSGFGFGTPSEATAGAARSGGPHTKSAGNDPYGGWVLGAPEAVIPGLDITDGERDQLSKKCQELAEQGLRTMVLAHTAAPHPVDAHSSTLTTNKTTPQLSTATPDDTNALRVFDTQNPQNTPRSEEQTTKQDLSTNQPGQEIASNPWFGGQEELPGGLQPAVLITFRENVRDDAAETLKYFRSQNVDLKIISGDSPHTVAAVAREVGWLQDATGFDARNLPTDPEELAEIADKYSIFGRVSPEQKKQLVEALQARDHVVAMTGDGINDALALKTADLGVAMGNAAPATKAVSRMVLLDSKFSRLPSVLAEGRTVIANMENLAHLFLTKTTYAFLFVLVFSLMAWQYPFLPRQTSTADALFVGMASFILALMPNPRRYVPGFLKRALAFAIPSGITIVVALIAINLYARIWAGDFSGTLPYVGTTAASAGTSVGAAVDVVLSMEQLHTATYITLVLTGLWLLNTVCRPLNWQKTLMLAILYVVFALTLMVPISLWYHQFILPPTPLIIAAVVIAATAGLIQEIIARIHAFRNPHI